MAVPSINDLKMWVGTLFTKDDWDFNFSKIVSWLSDGKGDLVVNTVKAGNGIDLDGAQLSNVGTASTGTDAVNLDQALTILNRTSFYYPFSVASGKVDSNGDAAYLQKDSDTQVTVLAGSTNPDLVCVQADGTVETVTANKVLTVPVTDGTYHIIKEKEAAISLTSGSTGKITIGKKFPTSQNIGDYFLNNSTMPFVGYKYTVDGWEETSFCYLGYVTVSSGTATVTTFSYNYNAFDSNNSIDSRRMAVSWGMPDYTAGVSKTWNTDYTADSDGYIFAGGVTSSNGSKEWGLTVAGVLYNFVADGGDVVDVRTTIFIPVSKGESYKATGGGDYQGNRILKFYPCKGV